MIDDDIITPGVIEAEALTVPYHRHCIRQAIDRTESSEQCGIEFGHSGASSSKKKQAHEHIWQRCTLLLHRRM